MKWRKRKKMRKKNVTQLVWPPQSACLSAVSRVLSITLVAVSPLPPSLCMDWCVCEKMADAGDAGPDPLWTSHPQLSVLSGLSLDNKSKQQIQRLWALLDVNGDGKLTSEDWIASPGGTGKWEMLRASFDFTGDNVVDVREFVEGLKIMALKSPLDPGCFAGVPSDHHECVKLLNRSANRQIQNLCKDLFEATQPSRRLAPNICLEHTSGVRAVALCIVDERMIVVSSSDDKLLRLWDARAKTAQVLEGHTEMVYAVSSCTVDGDVVVVSGSGDCSVRLWDARTGAALKVLSGHTDEVRAVSTCTLNERPVAMSGSADDTVRLWDAGAGTQLKVLEVGHSVPTIAPFGLMALSSCIVDGRVLLMSSGCGSSVRLWDATAGTAQTALKELELPESSDAERDDCRYMLALSSCAVDGDAIVVGGSGDGSVCLWDARTGAALKVLSGHTSRQRQRRTRQTCRSLERARS
jgi:WD40 repeat protein